jgi:hypothetical protein
VTQDTFIQECAIQRPNLLPYRGYPSCASNWNRCCTERTIVKWTVQMVASLTLYLECYGVESRCQTFLPPRSSQRGDLIVLAWDGSAQPSQVALASQFEYRVTASRYDTRPLEHCRGAAISCHAAISRVPEGSHKTYVIKNTSRAGVNDSEELLSA